MTLILTVLLNINGIGDLCVFVVVVVGALFVAVGLLVVVGGRSVVVAVRGLCASVIGCNAL